MADAPIVAALTHRLSECPGAFLEPALAGGAGVVHVDAVVADLVRFMGGPMLTAQDTKDKGDKHAQENKDADAKKLAKKAGDSSDDDSDKGKKSSEAKSSESKKTVASGDHDRGHGNDADGFDEDNPGKSKRK